MSVYTVTAQRTPKWWVLQAVEAPGAISQVARLDQASEIIEAIAFVTGEEREGIQIDLRPDVPSQFAELVARAERLRQEAAIANAGAAEAAREAAKTLQSAGLTLRDIGTMMGVSYQRAGQLVA